MLLDRALDDFTHFDKSPAATSAIMGNLCTGLSVLKCNMTGVDWDSFCLTAARHPLRDLLHEDPFCSRTFKKPRGYAGDAPMLDFIYRVATPSTSLSTTSVIGGLIHSYIIDEFAATAAVRERRAILAKLVDSAAKARSGKINVLSLACGHLRELELSESARDAKLETWYCADQDPASLAEISSAYPMPFVRPLALTVKHVLNGDHAPLGGPLHVVYAAGLYDYLSQDVAKQLTKRLYTMLAPGGTMLYANFAQPGAESAFMEAFMAWKLIYRTHAEMYDIMSILPSADIARSRVFYGDNRGVLYATVEKPLR